MPDQPQSQDNKPQPEPSQAPPPGSLPKLPQTIFNLEKSGPDNGGIEKRGE